MLSQNRIRKGRGGGRERGKEGEGEVGRECYYIWPLP